MKKKILTILLTGLSVFSVTSIYAQNSDVDTNIWMDKPIVVDGNSEEWHEPLNNFNSETKLAFALGNDQNTLYLVIESLDELTTGRLMRGGLTLNINTAGKKKDGIKLNFLGMQHADTEKSEHTTTLNTISVSGFKNIPDGRLAIPNNAGIQVVAAFNPRRDYICELAIPLALLELNGKEAKGIAYQIKINASGPNPEHRHEGEQAAQKAEGRGMSHGGGMGGGGMHGGGGGGRKGGGGRTGSGNEHDQNQNSAKSDFWIKYELAKN